MFTGRSFLDFDPLRKEMDAKAVAVLKKFGWEEGKGLGRHETGNAESIRVMRKSNTKGLGQRGSNWGNDWWDRMYSQALDNVSTTDQKTKGTKDTNDTQENDKSLLYGSFTRSKSLNTMLQESSDEESSQEESEEEAPPTADELLETERKGRAVHHMTDASVFEACNGMILRKFVPVGKLERIAQQEALYRAEKNASGAASGNDPELLELIVTERRKLKLQSKEGKKKQKSSSKDAAELPSESLSGSKRKRSQLDTEATEESPRKKKSKKKTKSDEEAPRKDKKEKKEKKDRKDKKDKKKKKESKEKKSHKEKKERKKRKSEK